MILSDYYLSIKLLISPTASQQETPGDTQVGTKITGLTLTYRTKKIKLIKTYQSWHLYDSSPVSHHHYIQTILKPCSTFQTLRQLRRAITNRTSTNNNGFTISPITRAHYEGTKKIIAILMTQRTRLRAQRILCNLSHRI